LRRAKALVQGAVKKSSQDRDIKDVLGRRRDQHSTRRHERTALFAAKAARATWCFPETRNSSKATCFRVSGEGRGRASQPGEGDGEDAFRFVLSRDEFVDLFLDDLELPDLAKRKLAEAESEGASPGWLRDIRLARQHFGKPYGAARDGPADRVATARGRKRSRNSRRRWKAATRPRRIELMAEIEALKAKISPDFRTSIRSTSDTAASKTMPKPVAQAVMFCLMDVSGSMSEHMKDLASASTCCSTFFF